MAWWLKNNIRMVQNNIRDIDDQRMDIDNEIAMLKRLHANVLQIGCGGITAHYPTKLPFQWKNQYLKENFLEEIIEKCHANDIRVIVRFDFSKTHESYLESNPEWFMRRADGSPVLYNDTVATCVNGDYQRKRSLDIIEEVLSMYPVDGIFFNAFGYLTSDYSGNYIGICQCDNCKQHFHELYSEVLPTKEDSDDPVFQKYQEFKQVTVKKILQDVHTLARSYSDEIAVSTYANDFVDIVRNESNSAVDRALPFWIYSSTDNVSAVEDGFDDKISSNCAINAVDIPYRFMGVPDALNRIRLYGNLAAGSGLDWCIIGNFDDYTDNANLEGVEEVFSFHERYESLFGHLRSMAKVMLVEQSDSSFHTFSSEYRGIYRMLKEEHIQFTHVISECLPNKIGQLDAYDFIILAGVRKLDPVSYEALQKTSSCVVGTGLALKDEGNVLQELFHVQLKDVASKVRGSYLRTVPEEVFPSFQSEGKQWVYLDKQYHTMDLGSETEGLLPLVERAWYGPPERCYGHEQSESFMASVSRDRRIYLPWNIGALYYEQGYEAMKQLFLETLQAARPLQKAFETNAPEMCEIFLSKIDGKTAMLQIINMCGFNGSTVFKPLKLAHLYVQFKTITPKAIKEMTNQGLRAVKYDNGFKFDMEDVYKAFLIEI